MKKKRRGKTSYENSSFLSFSCRGNWEYSYGSTHETTVLKRRSKEVRHGGETRRGEDENR